MINGNGSDAETASASDRRVWKRWNPAQGSSALSLKAMAVLYDAGQPLSRDELADRLLPQLDPYALDYLAAWYQRRLVQQSRANATYRGIESETSLSGKRDVSDSPAPRVALRRWISEIFARRVYGGTLIRDSDRRLRPGPRAPRAQTIEGALVPFTPEKRQELEQADHDRSHEHLALLAWSRGRTSLDLSTVEARAHLLIFLARRLLIGADKKLPFDERRLIALFDDVIRLADTPAVKQALMQRALIEIWPSV